MQVLRVSARIPAPHRVIVHHLALKLCTQPGWHRPAEEVDGEVTNLLQAEADFEQLLDRVPPRLCAAALPQRGPFPRAMALHAAETVLEFLPEPRVNGFYMARCDKSLGAVLYDGTLGLGSMLRIIQTAATGTGILHRQGLTPERRRNARRAGIHLGGLHCDFKPDNILLWVR